MPAQYPNRPTGTTPASDERPNAAALFGPRADDYARWRPRYAEAAVDAMIAGLGAAESIAAADVGAGTGILSRQLAERGVTVTAIEPDEAMRAAATPRDRVTVRPGTAERTWLDDASVELVTCAQAFHWLDTRAAAAEFSRVLKPGGRVAILWNIRVEGDAFMDAYAELVDRLGEPRLHAAFDRHAQTPAALSGLFERYRVERFDASDRLPWEGVVGRAMSASYVPREGEARAAFERELRVLFDAHATAAGERREVTWAMHSEVHLAERAS
jgi:SAM-dependent methyltransferase